MLQAAGWLEGALTISYEKLMLDADHLGALHTMVRGLALDDNAFAMDAFAEVGPGNHFFGSAHTLANYETAFHESELADVQSFENWLDAGELDSVVRANRRWKQLLRLRAPTARRRGRRGPSGLHGPAQAVDARHLGLSTTGRSICW